MKASLPGTLKGPLGGAKNYIAHIALPNCIDYFRSVERHRESGAVHTPAKYDEFRLFINAVESLNNIIEYIHFDDSIASEASDANELKKQFYEESPFLQEVAEIANAYKHCVRGGFRKGEFVRAEDALHASDLAKTTLSFRVGMTTRRPLSDVQFCFNGIDNESLLQNAFRFWVDYIQK